MCDEDTLNILLDRVEKLAEAKGHLRTEMEDMAETIFQYQKTEKKNAEWKRQIQDLVIACLGSPTNKSAQLKAIRTLSGMDSLDVEELLQESWEKSDLTW